MDRRQRSQGVEATGQNRHHPVLANLKVKGMINEKYPGSVEAQTVLLQQERHSVIKKGKNSYVKDYEKALIHF
jgi:hypothetical protein